MRRARMAGHLTQMQKKANEKREEEAKRRGFKGILKGFEDVLSGFKWFYLI